MPMIGMLGFDVGYGFDRVENGEIKASLENDFDIWPAILKRRRKKVNKSKFFILLFVLMNGYSFGQIKIGYVLSERIRTEYEEFKEAEAQLQIELKKVQSELEKISIKLDSLNQDYEVKRLMALDKGESIKKEMEQLELQGRKFQQEQFDPQNGQLMRKQAQMEFQILGKVKEAVQKVAIDNAFDYVMDASIGLLYVKPKYDITDEVLHELRNLTKKPNKILKFTLEHINKYVKGQLIGNKDLLIEGVSEINNSLPKTITFLGNSSYKKFLKSSNASAFLVSNKSFLDETSSNGIVVNNPQLAMAITLKLFYPNKKVQPFISRSIYYRGKCHFRKRCNNSFWRCD